MRFTDVAVQPSAGNRGFVKRAVGFVNVAQLVPLLDMAVLAPNPRSAMRNPIIEGILGTLRDDPALFRFKSKGLLVSSHRVEELQRNRFRIELHSKQFVDGVLDGGHNLFAIGLFVLSHILEEKQLKRIRTWDELDVALKKHNEEIRQLEFDHEDLVAVELLYPPAGDEETQDAFDQAAFDISQARNANTQVQTEAFQNKLGFYDVLKEALPRRLSERVEWKPGVVEAPDVKPISVRDIVALAWIPLNLANKDGLLPFPITVHPRNIYQNKRECSEKFNTLMKSDQVTETIGGKAGQTRQLSHKTVESCLQITGELPALVDLIYENFPHFYNNDGKRRFGSRTVVKVYDPERYKTLKADNKDVSGYTTTQPVTPYFQRSSSRMIHKYPEALIIPFVTGLSALMKIENDEVVWATDDIEQTVLDKLMKAAPLFHGQLDAYDWDPQRLAKSPSSHEQASSFYSVL